MRILVCGSRHWTNIDRIFEVLDDYAIDTDLVIEGCATGADAIAEEWAESREILISHHPAEWSKYGKSAGPKRNRLMLLDKPHAIFAFSNDIESSRGTFDMLNRAGKDIETRYLCSDKEVVKL